ncbi:Cyst wall-specific glycoprotein Jacob family protein [Entamoeba invadens IP1]|uniref:Cyst wall-specific glycoprotein Jacob family protein n=2 Tax=Entamoeba invadens TaxID=33085 RepID=A0A0A1U327_ENTIV|nr:Cyst wall-specific glycoprotein Jacob family protein [Entamoeba invadens IP1]ABC59317.2 Jacob 2 [Entamoeba invadens]ELP88457.1 Cyst wall-specific glycoprotein Jacob family protein [Entamoeba invadens IP1]|eukprot:XP_004255228.1 Cyst wall-specific glycoprotein Jacob family protein [Entamoeba invadens IP1]
MILLFLVITLTCCKVVTDKDVTFDCKENGLYCIEDGKHDNLYFECSNYFRGLRPCAPGTQCIGNGQKEYGYNPCGVKSNEPTTPSVTKSEEKSIDKKSEESKIPITPPIDKSGENAICKEDGFYCTGDNEHSTQYYICSETYKGYSKCPLGTKCGANGHYPFTINPCILDGYIFKSTENSEVKSVEKSTEKSSEVDVNGIDCKENGYYCVEDGKHDYQFYVCEDTFKGFMKCPVGTKCAGATTKPYTSSPCVLLGEKSVEKSLEKSVATPSVDKNEDIPSCKEEGLYCVFDGKHDHEYYICTEAYKGFSKCPSGTVCKGNGRFDLKVNPCVEDTTLITETSKEESKEKSEHNSETLQCKQDGLYCVIDGKHNEMYYQCSDFFNGFRACPKGTWCKGEQDKPYETNPCVWYDDTTWAKKN